MNAVDMIRRSVRGQGGAQDREPDAHAVVRRVLGLRAEDRIVPVPPEPAPESPVWQALVLAFTVTAVLAALYVLAWS